jgi:hypothetical protein
MELIISASEKKNTLHFVPTFNYANSNRIHLDGEYSSYI